MFSAETFQLFGEIFIVGMLTVGCAFSTVMLVYVCFVHLPKLLKRRRQNPEEQEQALKLRGKMFYVHIRTTDGRKTELESRILNHLIGHGAMGYQPTGNSDGSYSHPEEHPSSSSETIPVPLSPDCYTFIGILKTYRVTDPEDAISNRVLLDFKVIDNQQNIIFANAERDFTFANQDEDQDAHLSCALASLAKIVSNQVARHMENM